MKNPMTILAWLNGAIGIILMLLGTIAFLAGGVLFDHFWSNYFYPAYNFILMGIFFFTAVFVGKEKKA